MESIVTIDKTGYVFVVILVGLASTVTVIDLVVVIVDFLNMNFSINTAANPDM